ncbi:MAG: hypothetical protein LBN11_02135 [Tannerella sp.]|jgi:hypothetical protein|nr:hypothetical protein [Tannerella sp.]
MSILKNRYKLVALIGACMLLCLIGIVYSCTDDKCKKCKIQNESVELCGSELEEAQNLGAECH